MGLSILEKWVSVTNISGEDKRLYDRQLPNGFIDIPAGGEASLPAPVFQRNWRTSWFIRTENIPKPEIDSEEAEPVVKMAALRAKANELGIKFPVGTTKEEAMQLIAAVSEVPENDKPEVSIETD